MNLKKILAHVAGWAFILLGIIGIFLPVLQGFLFILVGLLILSPHLPWAKRLLKKLKSRFPRLARRMEEWKAKFSRFLKRPEKRR